MKETKDEIERRIAKDFFEVLVHENSENGVSYEGVFDNLKRLCMYGVGDITFKIDERMKSKKCLGKDN